jgi:hypothetical protein
LLRTTSKCAARLDGFSRNGQIVVIISDGGFAPLLSVSQNRIIFCSSNGWPATRRSVWFWIPLGSRNDI